MKIRFDRDAATQASLYAFILSTVIFLVGLFIYFMISHNEVIRISTFIEIVRLNPGFWIIGLEIIVIPVVVYLIYNYFENRLDEKQKLLEQEFAKSHRITDFIFKIIREEFDTEYVLDDENDKIGKSLLELRDTLKNNKKSADKRRQDDEIRSWTAEGLAKFGEILRREGDNLEKLASNIIKNITDYVGAIQGGFYLLTGEKENEKYFELTAFYAYGRKKYADKKLKWNKGLLGTAALERKTVYLTDLPDTYMSITSGLGKSNPRCLVVAPMIYNDELFGAFEIASLTLLEKHQIRFVERIAENTASILSTVKMNIQTARLLEESKAQAQALTSQEEEMRQNMEELQATQEEASRQAERFIRLENTVNHTMIRAEYSVDGTLIYANTRFLKKLEYESNSDVEGKHILMFIAKKDEEWFNRIWSTLSEGGRHFEGYMKHVTRTGKDLWAIATYTCIRDEEGEVERILFLALDTTEHKKLSLNLEGIVDAVNRAGIKVEFDINGNIKEYNDTFLYLFKYSEKEVNKLTLFDLLDTVELEIFNRKWDNIINGMNFQGQFKVKTKDNKEKWIRGVFNAVYDMYGDVDRVIYIGHDITNEKLMEIESKKQNEILKKQEKQLRESEKELHEKLKETKRKIHKQFEEIERIKLRNEITLEGALDAIISTSQQNKIIFFNNAAVALLGFTKDEIIGRDVGILFTEKDIDENDFINRFVNQGDIKIIGQRKEINIKTKNGKEIPVLIVLARALVQDEITYTAFIQTIEVELFN